MDADVWGRVQALLARNSPRWGRRRQQPLRCPTQGLGPLRALWLRDDPEPHDQGEPALSLLRVWVGTEARLAYLPVQVDSGRRDRALRRRPAPRQASALIRRSAPAAGGQVEGEGRERRSDDQPDGDDDTPYHRPSPHPHLFPRHRTGECLRRDTRFTTCERRPGTPEWLLARASLVGGE